MKYTNGSHFLVFVGSLNPRKNLKRIFQAFDKLTDETKLVIVGEKMSWDEEVELAYSGLSRKEKVVFTGRLEGEDLNSVLSASIALVFPSLFEGFGIPILEAYQAGTAVITATNSSMPEIAGDGAILVDALDVGQIRNAMELLINNEEKRMELIVKGHEQQKKYSWDRSGEKLWSLFQKVVNN